MRRSLQIAFIAVVLWAGVAWGATVTIPHVSGEPGGTLLMPIMVDDAAGMAGVELVLSYDPSILTAIGAELTALSSDFDLTDVIRTGKIAITMARSTDIISGGGPFVQVSFQINAGAAHGAVSPFTLSKVSLYNEDTQSIPVAVRNGSFTVTDEVPLIGSVPVTTQSEGTNLTISASVTDAGEVQSVILYYRAGGAQTFYSRTMSKEEGVPYEATIPESVVTYCGLEYYISASNAKGGVATFPEEGEDSPTCVQVTFPDCIAEQAYPTGIWKMFGVPAIPDNGSPSDILTALGVYDSMKWRLYRFYEGAYQEYTQGIVGNFAPGKAFWLHTRIPGLKLRTGSGQTTRTDLPFEITLRSGWNDISCPFAFPVLWEDVMAESGDPSGVAGPYTYDGNNWSYPSATDRFIPWEGYAVKNSTPNSIVIKVPPASAEGSAKPLAKTLADGEWMLRVKVETDHCGIDNPKSEIRNRKLKRRDVNNFLGFRADARVEWDRLDFPEPPPAPGEHVRLYFPHEEWLVYPDGYTSDFRPHSEGEVWRFVVEGNLEGSPAVLSFEGVSDLPEGLAASLLDVDSRISVDLREGMAYPVTVGWERRRFRIAVGSVDYVAEVAENFRGVPERSALSQNWPNPFNAETVISYRISERGPVRLVVYDLLGREVAILVDAVSDPGYFSVVWDGRDGKGQNVASGVYFSELGNRSKRIARKMAVVR